MSLKQRLRRLEKTMRGQLGYFELADGSLYFYEPEETSRITFLYLSDSLTADWKREPRPQPPELLRAVAAARDRGQDLALVMGDYSHLPIDREALVERGEFPPGP